MVKQKNGFDRGWTKGMSPRRARSIVEDNGLVMPLKLDALPWIVGIGDDGSSEHRNGGSDARRVPGVQEGRKRQTGGDERFHGSKGIVFR